jgi:hypothetical protein
MIFGIFVVLRSTTAYQTYNVYYIMIKSKLVLTSFIAFAMLATTRYVSNDNPNA